MEEDIDSIIDGIKSSHVKKTYFAKILGIHHYSLNKKIRDKQFKSLEIKILKKKLKEIKKILL